MHRIFSMQSIFFVFMSFAAISICFIPKSAHISVTRGFRISMKFNTGDLQGKMYPPELLSDGMDLMAIGIASTKVKNTQSLLQKQKYPIDKDITKRQIAAIKEILGVPHFQVDVWFCSDKKIGELNGEWRQQSKATDILSFPANDFESPGVFADDPSIEFAKHLGDLVLAPNYVMLQVQRDKEDYDKDELDLEDDAGVSREMANKFTLEERVPLLFIHGMIHLLGYDHETDEQFEEMTAKEDEVIQKYYEKMGIKIKNYSEKEA